MKFLVIQTAFIGDVVLATPILEALHRAQPGADIDMLVRKGNETLLTGHPFLRRVLVFDKQKRKYRNMVRMIGTIRRERYDVVINVQRFATTGVITLLSGAKETIGFDKNPLSRFFTRRMPHRIYGRGPMILEVDRNLSLAAPWTGGISSPPRLHPTKADFESVRQPGPYVCLAPASVWFTKRWPPARWADLARRLPETVAVHFIGGPGDREYIESIIRLSGREGMVNQAGRFSILQSAALMAGARMNYVNDSAPLHIASAMNAPVTAIFCSTVLSYGFGPLSDVSVVAQTMEDLPCRPCGLHGRKACPEGHFRCADFEVPVQLDFD